MGTYDMLWRDPLSTPGDRFPLGPPPEFWADSDDEPSEVGIRPYSLRGVVVAPKAEVGLDVSYSYDPGRQITLVRDTDGVVVPLSKLISYPVRPLGGIRCAAVTEAPAELVDGCSDHLPVTVAMDLTRLPQDCQ